LEGNTLLSEKFKKFISGLLCKNIQTRMTIDDALNSEWMEFAEKIMEAKEKINDIEKFAINLNTSNIEMF